MSGYLEQMSHNIRVHLSGDSGLRPHRQVMRGVGVTLLSLNAEGTWRI